MKRVRPGFAARLAAVPVAVSSRLAAGCRHPRAEPDGRLVRWVRVRWPCRLRGQACGRSRACPRGRTILEQIDHIIVLMMENHSFDSYFGMLESERRLPARKRHATAQNLDSGGQIVRAFHMPSACQADDRAEPGVERQPHRLRERQERRLRARERPGGDGVLDRRRHPLLLRARAHLPARHALVLLHAVPDVPQPAVPDGRHRRRDHQHRRATPCRRRRHRTATSSSGWTPTASPGRTTTPTSPP